MRFPQIIVCITTGFAMIFCSSAFFIDMDAKNVPHEILDGVFMILNTFLFFHHLDVMRSDDD